MTELTGGLRLDLACGNRKKSGFTGVDICSAADIVCDLEKFPWPFADSSADDVYCAHYIEHTKDLMGFFNELYRILKPGATAEIIAPYYSSIKAWQDPTHLRAISENTFYYYNREWRFVNKLGHYPIRTDFDHDSKFLLFPGWDEKDKEELKFAFRHYINVVDTIRTVLTKRGSTDPHRYELNEHVAYLWSTGSITDAVTSATQLIDADLADLFPYLIAGESARHVGEYGRAIELFKRAFNLEYGSLMAHAGFVVSSSLAGQQREAENHLNEIGAVDEKFAESIKVVMNMITEEH